MMALVSRHASAETRESVEHYLGHGEYEIALEGLCIDLMDSAEMTAADFSECVALGRIVRRDQQTVLRDDFWPTLLARASAATHTE